MGMIISQKPVKLTTIHNVLKLVWARYESITISDVSYKVMFEFENEDDRKLILDMSPWSVQGYCMCMKKWMSGIGLAQVDFKRVQFWGQVHNHRLEIFSLENVQVIGDKLDYFIKTEEDVENVHKTYIRMKVEVVVQNPLMVGFWWTNSQGVEQWASIKYECLSEFCYG